MARCTERNFAIPARRGQSESLEIRCCERAGNAMTRAMPKRHILSLCVAVLTLGWYLMIPPHNLEPFPSLDLKPVEFDARLKAYLELVEKRPLSEWKVVEKPFDTEDACRAHQELVAHSAFRKANEWGHNSQEPFLTNTATFAAYFVARSKCVASNDPRLVSRESPGKP